jgi:hypothetical protein
MLQYVIVYAIVAAAAGWVAWSILLPRSLKLSVKRKLGLGPKPGSARFPQPVPRNRR